MKSQETKLKKIESWNLYNESNVIMAKCGIKHTEDTDIHSWH